MVKTWNITFPAASHKERRRRAYVYLPTMYKEQPRRRFPVLYMFDGHNVFFDEHSSHGHSWRLAEYLDFTGIPLIVAAVECNHSPENGRLSEYSPWNFSDGEVGYVEGRGHETMEWFVHHFKATVDRRFRTIPWREKTFIGGSSMGGLMSLYAVARYNHIFSRAAALSPHVWSSPSELLELLGNAPMSGDTAIYMDWGSDEVDASMARGLRDVADTLFGHGIAPTVRVVPGGDHSEASWEKQAPFFIETLMYGLDA